MRKKIDLLGRELKTLPQGSLYLKRSGTYTSFVHYVGNGKHILINRNLDLVYRLARKKYLSLYIPVLNGANRDKLNLLLAKYKDAGLDIARITLSTAQYQWSHDSYATNPFRKEDKRYASISGVMTRSKSEREILNQYELLGIPVRYEAALEVDLSSLVHPLKKATADFRAGQKLFHYSSGVCIWNVPPELSWMNMPGSIWRGMNPQTNTTIIYPDFSTLTFDKSIIYHEHEGVASDPFYRCTSSDRMFVLRETGTVSSQNLITTFENDVADTNILIDLLKTRIVPFV